MSTTGNDLEGQSTEAAHALLLMPPASTWEAAMERAVLGNRAVGSPAYPAEETELRDKAARASTVGSIRQALHVNWRRP